MMNHAVVIAGGGPTGLMLAAELALSGVDAAVVEKRADQSLAGTRAGGLHARTLEVLDQRGIVDRFLARGKPMQVAGFAMIPLDISDFPTRHNYGLALPQNQIELLLAQWAAELGVTHYRASEVTDFVAHDSGVDVSLDDGRTVGGRFLIGCDGGRSFVRKRAGIEFAGWDASVSYIIAEVELAEEPTWGMRRSEKGMSGIGKLDDGRRARIVLAEPTVKRGEDATLADLQEALRGLYGTDFGVRNATWISRFSDMARQAVSYRAQRVLLAGDAAHVHSPTGGQGLNVGLQDAVNLGWKLSQVLRGSCPDTLLDTYHSERHPVAAGVLKNTLAQTALARGDAHTQALHDVMSELLGMDLPRKRYAGMMSGLTVHYDLGEGHPLLGRRMPDLDISTAYGARRVFALLHAARPVLINFGNPDSIDIAGWAEAVRWVNASYAGAWELPVIGAISPPSAVLVRPDGYVAWVGNGTEEGLHEALLRWCGPPELS